MKKILLNVVFVIMWPFVVLREAIEHMNEATKAWNNYRE